MKHLLVMVVLLSMLSVAIAIDVDNYIDVKISDSSYSKYDAGDLLAEANSIADSPLDEGLIGDPQMELLAKSLDCNGGSAIDGYGIDANNGVTTGIAHISWLSGESMCDNLTSITSLSKFVQVWGNSTQGAISSKDAIFAQNGSNSEAIISQDSVADAISIGSIASSNPGNTGAAIQGGSNSQIAIAQSSVADTINAGPTASANAGADTTISSPPDASEADGIADHTESAFTADAQQDISANTTAS